MFQRLVSWNNLGHEKQIIKIIEINKSANFRLFAP